MRNMTQRAAFPDLLGLEDSTTRGGKEKYLHTTGSLFFYGSCTRGVLAEKALMRGLTSRCNENGHTMRPH